MKHLSILISIVIVLLIGLSTANAQRTNEPAASQNDYAIDWYTIDGGGMLNSTGGSYSLSGSIGQPDAGTLGGGGYTLNGGFWFAPVAMYRIYLPLMLKR
jgi:hypothetical protein